MEYRRTPFHFLFLYLFVNNVFIGIQSKERKYRPRFSSFESFYSVHVSKMLYDEWMQYIICGQNRNG